MFTLRGWRQPKGGRWQLAFSQLRALPPVPSAWLLERFLLGALVAIALVVTAHVPFWLVAPMFGAVFGAELPPPPARPAEDGKGGRTFPGGGGGGVPLPPGLPGGGGGDPRLRPFLPQVFSSVSVGGGAPPREFRDLAWFNLEDFGPVDRTGVTDVAFALRAAAIAVNAAGGGSVLCPPGTFLLSSDPFAGIAFVAPCRITGAGMQATIWKKGFNGPWFTYGVNFGYFFRWEHVTFDGQHDAGRTGAGFVYTGNAGGAGNDYHSYFRCRFLAIESHFSIGQDAAYALSLLDCEAYPSAAQQGAGEYSFFAPSADDTNGNARHRRITHGLFPLGVFDISGMQDIYMATCGIKRLHSSATSSEYYISACLLGNPDAAHPLKGNGTVSACRFAGDVVLDATFTGAFVGNFQTAGTFTDNTVSGNAIIFHHPLGGNLHVLGQRQSIRINSSFQSTIVVGAAGNVGDSDVTLTAGSNFPTIRYATTLTANRVVTLSTTGARNGDQFRISRTGLGAFTLDVGGLKTIPSATAAFVDVEYDGTAWRLTGYGVL